MFDGNICYWPFLWPGFCWIFNSGHENGPIINGLCIKTSDFGHNSQLTARIAYIICCLVSDTGRCTLPETCCRWAHSERWFFIFEVRCHCFCIFLCYVIDICDLLLLKIRNQEKCELVVSPGKKGWSRHILDDVINFLPQDFVCIARIAVELEWWHEIWAGYPTNVAVFIAGRSRAVSGFDKGSVLGIRWSGFWWLLAVHKLYILIPTVLTISPHKVEHFNTTYCCFCEPCKTKCFIQHRGNPPPSLDRPATFLPSVGSCS